MTPKTATAIKKHLDSMNPKSSKKPANHNRRWTEGEENALLHSYALGESIDVIAKNFGRTKVSILGRLAWNNLIYFDKDKNAYYTLPALMYQF